MMTLTIMISDLVRWHSFTSCGVGATRYLYDDACRSGGLGTVAG